MRAEQSGEIDSGRETSEVVLCTFPDRDPITGRRCILLDGHNGDDHRVDTPLLDSDQWEEARWRDYEAAFGRHVTPSE